MLDVAPPQVRFGVCPGYGDSILVGERVRLRGVRDDDLPTLAKWEMDPGRMATLSNRVTPPSEAAAKERIGKWSANEKDDLGFAIQTLGDPPVLVEEGRHRESVLHDGRWYDEVLMSILDHDWAARR